MARLSGGVRVPWLAVATIATTMASLSCADQHDVCRETPPQASEVRASCRKNGRPADCAEAMDLCRGERQSPGDFCRSICHADPEGRPTLDACRLTTPDCAISIRFERVECDFCVGL